MMNIVEQKISNLGSNNVSESDDSANQSDSSGILAVDVDNLQSDEFAAGDNFSEDLTENTVAELTASDESIKATRPCSLKLVLTDSDDEPKKVPSALINISI